MTDPCQSIKEALLDVLVFPSLFLLQYHKKIRRRLELD